MSREMQNVLAVAEQFHQRPSQILGLRTEIACYCFDTAAVAYIRYLEDKKTPRFPGDEKKNPGLQALMR